MFGCFSINFLVLSVVHDGIAFPIFWTFLPKKGTSNPTERIALLEQFIAVFGTYKIACLLADREFFGHEWFAYLQAQHIRFYIRVKRNMTVSRPNGALAPALNFLKMEK